MRRFAQTPRKRSRRRALALWGLSAPRVNRAEPPTNSWQCSCTRLVIMKASTSSERVEGQVARATTIRQVMTACPTTIGSDQTLSTAHKVMRGEGLRHLPVLRAGKLVGMLSQRDLYFLETIAGVDIEIDKVADAMTPDVYTTGPDESLRDVARVMAERKYGCAVVMERGRVLGIFTVTDALRHLAEALA